MPAQTRTMRQTVEPRYQDEPVMDQHVKQKTKKSSAEKRIRTKFTSYQLIELEKKFKEERFLERVDRYNLSLQLNLSERVIKVWFQNRRIKEKKSKDERRLEDRNKNSVKFLSIPESPKMISTMNNVQNGPQAPMLTPSPDHYCQQQISYQQQQPLPHQYTKPFVNVQQHQPMNQYHHITTQNVEIYYPAVNATQMPNVAYVNQRRDTNTSFQIYANAPTIMADQQSQQPQQQQWQTIQHPQPMQECEPQGAVVSQDCSDYDEKLIIPTMMLTDLDAYLESNANKVLMQL